VFTGRFLSGPVTQQQALQEQEAADTATQQKLLQQLTTNKLAAQGDN